MGRALAVWEGSGTQVSNGSSQISSSNVDDIATGEDSLAIGEFPADLHGMRRRLPNEWAAFLRAHFQGPTHIAAFFCCDEATARGWLSGKHGVNAAPLLLLIRENEVARQFFLGAVA